MFKFNVALVVLAGNVAAADSFHVATSGNDGAAGTSGAPWRTIQRAADAAAAGDTITVHAGTYAGFGVDARGTEAAPIVFSGDGAVTTRSTSTAGRGSGSRA
jgi:hypothetical protein